MPLQLQLETSAYCNAKCIFCPYPQMKRPHGFMDMHLFHKIIDDAAHIPLIEDITLTGLGEPLLDKHIIERIRYIRQKVPFNVTITAYTNGTYLTEQMAMDLVDAGISILYVSMNAIDARRRSAIMKLDDFEKVVAQTRRAIEIFKTFGSNQTVVVKAIQEKDLMESTDPQRFLEMWNGPVDQGGNGFLHMEGNWAGAIRPMRVRPETSCNRAIGEIMVLWDGRVSLCCFDGEGEVIFGDLNKQTIREVYNSEKALAYRVAHAEGRRGSLRLCSTCTAI